MKFTGYRAFALSVGLLYMVFVLFGQQSSIQVINPVTEAELRETESHIGQLAVQIARIEATLEAQGKTSQDNHTTLMAIAVPVGLLALEGIFRLLTAMSFRRYATREDPESKS